MTELTDGGKESIELTSCLSPGGISREVLPTGFLFSGDLLATVAGIPFRFHGNRVKKAEPTYTGERNCPFGLLVSQPTQRWPRIVGE